MSPEGFRQNYLCQPVSDKEYEFYRKLWDEYRQLTKGMPQSMLKECISIRRKLFDHLPKGKKYQQAKMDSLNKGER